MDYSFGAKERLRNAVESNNNLLAIKILKEEFAFLFDDVWFVNQIIKSKNKFAKNNFYTDSISFLQEEVLTSCLYFNNFELIDYIRENNEIKFKIDFDLVRSFSKKGLIKKLIIEFKNDNAINYLIEKNIIKKDDPDLQIEVMNSLVLIGSVELFTKFSKYRKITNDDWFLLFLSKKNKSICEHMLINNLIKKTKAIDDLLNQELKIKNNDCAKKVKDLFEKIEIKEKVEEISGEHVDLKKNKI